MEPTSQIPQQQHYTESKYRYVNLFVFILAAGVNGLPSQAFASISSLVERQFNYSSVVLTLNVLLSSIVHPFMATPTNLILDKFGVRIGVTIGGVLVILGVWARTLMQVDHPQWSLIGSTLSGIGNLYLISCPSMFALKWFSNQSTPKIIAATVLINLLSSGFGASLAGFMLPASATSDDVKRFFQIQAIIVTIPFIIFFILYRQKPKHPPSRAAAATKEDKQKQPYIQTLKHLARNKSYLKVVLSMSFSYGIFLSFVSILDSSLNSLGYSHPGRVTSITLGSAMLMGVFSAFFFSYAVRATLKFKYIISLCLFGAVLTFLLLNIIFISKVESYPVIGISGACAGFFVIPLTALFTTYSAELTFPIAQGSATGYLFAGSQAIGFISGLIWAAFLQKQTPWRVYVIFGAHVFFIGLSLFISLNTEQHLNKTNYEQGRIKSIQNIQDEQKLAQSLLSAESGQNKKDEVEH